MVTTSQRASRAKAEEDARNQALFVLQQLGQSLDLVDSVLEPRFRQSVRRVLAEASSAHRPESILRKILQITSRLETYRPPIARIVREPPYPEVLRQLEIGLRRVIASRLSALTPNWWAERVPEEVRSKAERWKANRERVWPWLDIDDHPVEEYLGFPDYAKIIFEPHNWEQAFSTLFVEAEPLRVKLRELEPIRTDIAHSRRLTPTNRRRLDTYAEDILTVVDTQ